MTSSDPVRCAPCNEYDCNIRSVIADIRVVPIDRLFKGNAVPTIVAYHSVRDKAHWLASPKRKEFFGSLGITNIRTFVDPQNPTRVAVLLDVPDMGTLMSAMKSKAAADAMAYDGVLPETLVILVETEKS